MAYAAEQEASNCKNTSIDVLHSVWMPDTESGGLDNTASPEVSCYQSNCCIPSMGITSSHQKSIRMESISIVLPLSANRFVTLTSGDFTHFFEENHIKSATTDKEEQGNNEDRDSTPEEDESKDSKDLEKQNMVQEDWYSRHRSLVSQKSMTRSYVFINSFLCLILGGLAMIIILMDVNFYAIHGSIQTLYVIIALALVVVIRNVQDAFFLKREFLGNQNIILGCLQLTAPL